MDYIFNSYKGSILLGGINLLTDNISIALMKDTWVPDIAGQSMFNDLDVMIHECNPNEKGDSGYGYGGQLLTNKVIGKNNTNNSGEFICDNVIWPNSSIIARYAVVYKSNGTDYSDSRLIFYIDFGENKQSTNGNFTVIWNSNGALSNVGAGV